MPARAHLSPVLQQFLSSPKPALKFAATRTLASLALLHPTSVAVCNVDLENLITDTNRSVTTYAITTLLKVSYYLLPLFTILLNISSDRQRSFRRPPHEANHRLHDRNPRRIQSHHRRRHPFPLSQVSSQTCFDAHLPFGCPSRRRRL